MRIWKRLTKYITALAVAAILLTPMRTYAAEGDKIDPDNRSGVIAITYNDRNHQPITGMRVRVYRIASAEGEISSGAVSGYTLHYALTEDFKQFDEQTGTTRVTGFSEEALNDALVIRTGESESLRASRWQSIASTIRYYAVSDVTPSGSKQTRADGSVEFTDLAPGLYLLVADGAVVTGDDAEYRYTYLPTFISLPQYKNGTWDYGAALNFDSNDPTLSPKFSYERIDRDYEYSIYKRWYSDTTAVRPAEIRVDLYRNNTFYQTIYLSEANGWYYRWTSSGRYSWYAVERTISPGYSVTIATSGTAITFSNTYTPPPPETPPGDTPPPTDPPPVDGEVPEVLGARRRPDEPAVLGARRLPRTGQLWWPVPVLAGAGLIFLTAGALTTRRSK